MTDLTAYAKKYIGVVQGSTKHKMIINAYNTEVKPLPRGYKVKTTDNWCATFVSFIMKRCGVITNLYECSAQRMKDRFEKNKCLISDNTKGRKNDIIFFDWDGHGWSDHVGIIEKTDKSNYYTIEGNKSKKVGTRKIAKNSKSISGIGRIKK